MTASVLPLALFVSLGAAAQEPQDRRGAVSEQAFVERVVVDAHVTGPDGNPIPNLTPADFRVRVDGRPVTLESVDWLPAGAAEIESVAPEETASSERVDNRLAEAPPGRLIVMFFQTNYEPSRLIGLIRMATQARRFLETMLPTDRVAVASYDSHLKLRQDLPGGRGTIRPGTYTRP